MRWLGLTGRRRRIRGDRALCLEQSAHQQTDSKARSLCANRLEPTRRVEALGMWVADDVNGLGSLPAGRRCTVFNEPATIAALPGIWLNEQRIELRVAVGAGEECGEASNRSRSLDYKDAASVDLFERQIDGIRISKQGLTVSGIAERCTRLQRLERTSFGRESQSDLDVVVHGAPHYGVRPNETRISCEGARGSRRAVLG